ncbi:CLUMA_CG016698, isoform A [Clunio marinus]|uniref:CLUMA_CG016698, isoform A n=1 Tax=Clunio marinus TaxID=568069 RepID=A0A1J1IY30_9DIPT|nr:CLUMA_CG016698, isoform A [Clunio marinus]
MEDKSMNDRIESEQDDASSVKMMTTNENWRHKKRYNDKKVCDMGVKHNLTDESFYELQKVVVIVNVKTCEVNLGVLKVFSHT